MFSDWAEPFDLVTQTGEPYGKVEFCFSDLTSMIYIDRAISINDYDIIRRMSDGQTFRVLNVRNGKFPNGKTSYTKAFLIPYKL